MHFSGLWATGTRRVFAVILITLCAASLGVVQSVHGQDLTPEDRVGEIYAAFELIADHAAAGSWEEADWSFNLAVDAMDRHAAALVAVTGQVGADSFAQIETLLGELDVALRDEDVQQVRAVVGFVQARLAPLAPGLGMSAPPEEATDIVLGWRRSQEQALALAKAGQWRDSRNAAIALVDDITSNGPTVESAAGQLEGGAERAAPLVRTARVFAMRLREAALDQSVGDSETSSVFFRKSADGLLTILGVLPAAEPTAQVDTRLRFRVYQVLSGLGERTVVPIKAESIPNIGLGSYRIRARWSPQALRLANVEWDVGQGSLLRDDAAGTVELALPPAPTGPSGDEVLAQLHFEVLAREFGAAGYLPAREIEALTVAADLAQDHISQADVPKAAGAMARAYTDFTSGRARPGSLYQLLDQEGLAEMVAEPLLTVVDLASQPADIDVTVAALAVFRHALAGALDLYRLRLAEAADIPVTLEVLEVADTRGEPLPYLESVHGGIVLPVAATPDTTEPTVPPDLMVQLTEEAGGADGSAAGDDGSQGGTPGLPSALAGASASRPLIVALLLGSLVGVAAVWWAFRQASEQTDISGEQ